MTDFFSISLKSTSLEEIAWNIYWMDLSLLKMEVLLISCIAGIPNCVLILSEGVDLF